MNLMRRLPVCPNLFLCCLLSLSCLASVTYADTLRTVAFTGDAAPGTELSFLGFGTAVLNDTGLTAFTGGLTGTGVDSSNGSGIWSEGGGDGLALVARNGDAAPGTSGDDIFFGIQVSTPTFNDRGQTAFSGTLVNTTSNAKTLGIWAEEGDTGLALVARSGDATPTIGGSVNFLHIYSPNSPAIFNNKGQAAFRGVFTGTEVDSNINTGIWLGGGGNGLALVVRGGDPAPNSDGAVFSSFAFNFGFSGASTPVLNDAGQTAFVGGLVGTGIDNRNDRGIWSEGGGNGLTLVAREGNIAPDTGGAVFSQSSFKSDPSIIIPHSSNTPAINGIGQTAFRGHLSGTGVNSSLNGSGIWSEGGGSGLALVVRSGDTAPGTDGADFSGFGSLVLINGAGQAAFMGNLTGAGVDDGNFGIGGNNFGIWSEGGGNGLTLVARKGDPAPGAGGAVFSRFSPSIFNPINNRGQSLILNDVGQMAFVAQLTGSELMNDEGIWAQDRSGELKLIARLGDLLDVDDGPDTDFRTISSLRFVGSTGNGDGRPSGFNNLGQLVFSAGFTDGTSGVFVSNLVAVPEPSSLLLFSAAGISLLLGRRSRTLRMTSASRVAPVGVFAYRCDAIARGRV